jgi:signal transduction histidine kinase/CheY-like chemotaxis protein
MILSEISRLTSRPDPTPVGVRENLNELRETILVYMLIGTGLLTIAETFAALPETLPAGPFQSKRFLVWVSLGLLGLLALAFHDRSPIAARHLFVWGNLAWFLAAIWYFPSPWVPIYSLLGILLSSLLVPLSALIYALATLGLAGYLVRAGQRSYPLTDLFLTSCLGLFVAFILRKTLLTALEWAWSSQQWSDRLLREARDHRAEASRAFKSLDIAYSIQAKIQDELLSARQEADEARQAKERFAANISHELRTPLNLILGFSEVMVKSPETYGNISWTPTLRRDIYQIYRSSEHLLEMIDDVLDLSRDDALGYLLSKELVPIRKTILEAIDIGRDLFAGGAVALETDLAPDLPTLEIDVTRIRQVLINLLKNARNFTAQGCVRVAARTEADRVVISVKDTGQGIPQEKVHAVFDEFYQVDESRSRRRQGTGLGLAICKRLVEAHEGSIWVLSQEGVGTEFSFALPLPNKRFRALRLSGSDLGQVLQPTARPCLLVVDADPVIVRLIARRLGDLEAVQVEDVSLLEEYVSRYRPCAVVVNTFPNQARPIALKGDGSVPVIQVSLPSQAWLAKELGIADSLTKPVTFSRLLESMARCGQAKEVLIVDDDREFVQLICRYLQSSGREYNVRFAYDGDEGWRSLCQQPPDLLLLDVIMPGRDGFEVIEAMKRNPSLATTEVILITGTHFEKSLQEKYESQMHVQMRGGLSNTQILTCIRALVDLSRPGAHTAG